MKTTRQQAAELLVAAVSRFAETKLAATEASATRDRAAIALRDADARHYDAYNGLAALVRRLDMPHGSSFATCGLQVRVTASDVVIERIPDPVEDVINNITGLRLDEAEQPMSVAA
jgi:hypothetical protein